MKDCCKTGDENPKTRTGTIRKWIIYLLVIASVLFILFNQLVTVT